MPKQTIANMLESALASDGWTYVLKRSGKYSAYSEPDFYYRNRETGKESPCYVFIGRNGAVRTGSCASKSHSNLRMRNRLLKIFVENS